jgi:hypothetical protein
VYDKTILAAIIAAIAAVVAACFGVYQGYVAARQSTWEVELRRRDNRLETYQKAIDLLTDFAFRSNDKDYDVEHEFSIPFVRAANRVRVHGSPASVAAMDEVQRALAKMNHAKSESEQNATITAFNVGLDDLIIATRDDVGPKKEDGLWVVPFMPGAGPRTE